MNSSNGKVTNALAVVVLDPKIRAYLEANDPKALLQAIDALRSVNFRFPPVEAADTTAESLRDQ